MDFFAEQRHRWRRSVLFYALFLWVALLHVLVAWGVVTLVIYCYTQSLSLWSLLLAALVVVASFGLGSYVEYRKLRAGGRAVAQRVGAVRLFIDNSQNDWTHRDHTPQTESVHYSPQQIKVRDAADFPPVYRRYHDYAQQLAIAAGIPMPILYVLPQEQGINAFVAGYDTRDTVLVVTQGALDRLSDQGLYGLIGHEYGHILHGDARFNVRLLILLAGLQLVYDWGETRTAAHRFYHRSAMAHQGDIRKANNQSNPARNHTASMPTTNNHDAWVSYWRQYSPQPIQNTKSSATSSLLLRGVGAFGMLCAQWLKHCFNRERELLADATSVQLTRSPAVFETLATIYQDGYGSQLTHIGHQHGLSHFFFASGGMRIGGDTWLATHPSLDTRMQAVDRGAYWQLLSQTQAEKKANRRAIADRRRLGDWADTKLTDKPAKQSDTVPLIFTPPTEQVVNGRLVRASTATLDSTWLTPWKHTPQGQKVHVLVHATDSPSVKIPQYVRDYLYHPLGAQAVVEVVLLCHQHIACDSVGTYGLSEIWCASQPDAINSGSAKILPHSMDSRLFAEIAALNRAMDSALIYQAMHHWHSVDLSEARLDELKHAQKISHLSQDSERYQRAQRQRTMLLRYYHGLGALLEQHISADVSAHIDKHLNQEKLEAVPSLSPVSNNVIALWQALHLHSVWQSLARILQQPSAYPKGLQQAPRALLIQMDPSKTLLMPYSQPTQVMLVLCAYRLANDTPLPRTLRYLPSTLTAYRRYARLMDIDLSAVHDNDIQWLLLTAAKLNSVQLLALIQAIPRCSKTASSAKDQQIDYNDYRRWLSTLHTIMLHDTMIHQDEYDCLVGLAEMWLGERQLMA